jgi:APA family basic amino acid/polyamine antiporter
MSRDGLLPPFLSRVHARFKTPYITTWITGGVVTVAAALTPIDVSSELCSIGTLFAYIIVAAGVIVLRYLRPDLHRPFRAPLSPFLPAIGIVLCGYLMKSLPLVTWYRFLAWLVLGLIIYFGYSSRKSLIGKK